MKSLILTVGGLCPGQNNIIQGLTLKSLKRGHEVLGGKFGFDCPNRGLVELNTNMVWGIDAMGGSILGTSRVKPDPKEFVDWMESIHIDTVYISGGNGGQHACLQIHKETSQREKPIMCVGLPKSIDNDIPGIDKCFGFDTAVESLEKMVPIMECEAQAVPRGVGVLKVMGRDHGHIAHELYRKSSLDLCVTPEMPFKRSQLDEVIQEKGWATMVVAEACAVPELPDCYVKVVEPGYLVRGVPANEEDSLLCRILSQYAISAALQGMGGHVVGLQGGVIRYVPLENIM